MGSLDVGLSGALEVADIGCEVWGVITMGIDAKKRTAAGLRLNAPRPRNFFTIFQQGLLHVWFTIPTLSFIIWYC